MEKEVEQERDRALSCLSYHPIARGQHTLAVILVRLSHMGYENQTAWHSSSYRLGLYGKHSYCPQQVEPWQPDIPAH